MISASCFPIHVDLYGFFFCSLVCFKPFKKAPHLISYLLSYVILRNIFLMHLFVYYFFLMLSIPAVQDSAPSPVLMLNKLWVLLQSVSSLVTLSFKVLNIEKSKHQFSCLGLYLKKFHCLSLMVVYCLQSASGSAQNSQLCNNHKESS